MLKIDSFSSNKEFCHGGLSTSSGKIPSLTGLPGRAAPLFSFNLEPNPFLLGIADYGEARVVRNWESVPLQIGWWDRGHAVVVKPDLGGQVFVHFEDEHENLKFLNSSIASLAACVGAYRAFEVAAIQNVGEDAFFEGEFPDSVFEVLRSTLEQVDPACLGEGRFWKEQLEIDCASRAEYRRRL